MICLHHRTKHHGQTKFDVCTVSFFPGALSGDIVGKRAYETPIMRVKIWQTYLAVP